ncbi:MAG: DUF1700 domain-containing protein [Clostridia bacterium]|nr:DUF1700 domain-containing protein [Clostridia bacterium]
MMTMKRWKRIFYRSLKGMDGSEKKECFDYYDEMYKDKSDSGMDEESILSEFGDPAKCAESILAELGEKSGNNRRIGRQKSKSTGNNPIVIIGYVLLLLLVGLPLGGIVVAIVLSFGAVSVSGAVCVLGGILYSAFSPFIAVDVSSALGNAGIGICTAGVGILLAVGFAYLTVYSCKWCISLIKKLCRR